MRRVVLLAALLCAAPLVGCSSEDPAVAEESLSPFPEVRQPARPVPGVEAEAVLLRTDAAAGGRIQVRITASAEFTVTSVALDSPGFEPVPPRPVASEFVPGRVTDLRTPLGEVRCDLPPEPASARLTVVRDGAPEEVDVPLTGEALARIHADECAERELARRVTVELGDLRDDADGLTATATLVRRSGRDEVQLTRVLRSVLVGVEADLPLTMAAEEPSASTTLRFTPASCDPHVLAETKQPFLFPAGIQVGPQDEVTVELPVTEAVRARLQAMVERVCA